VIETPHGPARVLIEGPDEPRAALVLGHGAGGGVEAPDLLAAARAARELDVAVARVEQPYRAAGRRSPPRPAVLDAAWLAVIEHLTQTLNLPQGGQSPLRVQTLDVPQGGLSPLRVPLVVGGRSSGARVACRTAAAAGAVGVLCLAFPLVPPRRGDSPPQSRLAELDAVEVPTLVVQGERDRFGVPPAGPSRAVVTVAGDHALKADPDAVAAAVREWLGGLIS
jgi:predicted alpha/beta-hydrolase family hydrolase